MRASPEGTSSQTVNALLKLREFILSGEIKAGERMSELLLVEDRPGFMRELPAWMCDAEVCTGIELGAPQVSIKALELLAAVLADMSGGRVGCGSSSGDPASEEPPDATTLITTICAAAPELRERRQPTTKGAADERPAPGSGGPAARGDGRGHRRHQQAGGRR